MKITLELNLPEHSLEYLEQVAKETNMTVSEVAKKFSKHPFILETFADTFGPLVKRMHERERSKKSG